MTTYRGGGAGTDTADTATIAKTVSARETFTATSGQTVFTLTEFTYTPGANQIDVYVEGVKQLLTTDYLESSTSTITFNTGITLNDVVEVEAFTFSGIDSSTTDSENAIFTHDSATQTNVSDALKSINYDTAQELKTTSGAQIQVAFCKGLATVADGDGGIYYWDSTSTATDTSATTGSVVKQNGVETGRWLRVSRYHETTDTFFTVDESTGDGTITGDLTITGYLDTDGGTPSSNDVLLYNATNGRYEPGPVSSAPAGNATTLDSLDSTDFLRATAEDSYTPAAVHFTNAAVVIGLGDETATDGNETIRLTHETGGDEFAIEAGNYYSSGNKYATTGDGATAIAMNFESQAGSIELKTAATGTADVTVTWANTLTLDASGLTFDDNVTIDDGTNAVLLSIGTSATTGPIGLNIGGAFGTQTWQMYRRSSDVDSLRFEYGGTTEVFTLDPNGAQVWGTLQSENITASVDASEWAFLGTTNGGTNASGLYFDAGEDGLLYLKQSDGTNGVILDSGGTSTFLNTVSINDLDVTTNIDTDTLTATGNVSANGTLYLDADGGNYDATIGIGASAAAQLSTSILSDYQKGFSRYYTSHTGTPDGSWNHVVTVKDNANRGFQIAVPDIEDNHFYFRNQATDGTAWAAWRQVITDAGGQSVAGTTTLNDLNVTTNIDTATLTATGAVNTGDLDVTGDITVSGTVDGVDIATRDGVLTATTTTANSAIQPNDSPTLNALTVTGLTIGATALTSTAAELNVLDGYTGSVTELNYLDTLHATGVTSTEFDYLDGVTSNIQTQLNARYESGDNPTFGNITVTGTVDGVDIANDTVQKVAEVTGHVRAGNIQIWDGSGTDPVQFNLSTVVTEAAWETVGPTGAGADNTWAAMDDIPSEATMLIVDFGVVLSPSGTGAGIGFLYAVDGSITSPTAGLSNRRLYYSIDQDADVSGNSGATFRQYIPLDANQVFKVYWDFQDTDSGSIVAYYQGFITD